MTETQELLDQLGWSQYHAAKRLGVGLTAVRGWATGRNTRGNPSTAPIWALDYLRRVVVAVEREVPGGV
jgi:transcriptional regulator with XRE-family HTH domain